MKLLFSLLASALVFCAAAAPVMARDAVSVDFFYDNLDPYGNWREVGEYGYCWQPRDVSDDWQPYSDGRWVYTDAGWTWDTEEPFGWAVYHYGRWVNVGRVGWVWVPGTEWGPGWVSWRHSSQYVGWAPLPPEARFLRAIGLNGWVDDYYGIGPSNYRFVENRDFGAPRLRSVFIDQRQNISIIHQTTNITNITYVNNVVHNGGPTYDQQSRQSRDPIQRYKLNRRQEFDGDFRNQPADHLRSRVEGDSLSVLALPFSGSAGSAPRKLGDKINRAEVNHGWKNAGTPAEIAATRLKMKSKEKAPEKMPPPTVFEKIPDAPNIRDAQRPNVRPPMPTERPTKPKSKDNEKPGRPDMPPVTPDKPSRPADRPPTPGDAGKGDRNKAPSPMVRPSSEQPNPGGRNKMRVPQLPRTEDRPPARVAPKEKAQQRIPQITPPKVQPAPVTPKLAPPIIKPATPTREMPKVRSPNAPAPTPSRVQPSPQRPKINPPKLAPSRPTPQVRKPAPPAQAPPKAAPPAPSQKRDNVKPGDRKKKKDD